MFEREAGHLSPGHVMDAAAGELADAAAKAHLAACGECGRSVEDWRKVRAEFELLRALEPRRSAGACPAVEELANYLTGVSPVNPVVAAHVMECARCGEIAREALEAEPDTGALLLKTSGREWRARTVATYAGRPAGTFWRYAAVAAMLVAVAVSLFWWKAERAPDPATLLAKAYTEARPFPYRLGDANYGPVRQTRGAVSTFNRPESLLAAEMEIQRRLASHPEDPGALTLRGESLLLEGDSDGAIQSFTKASGARPDSPEILAGMGVAYARRGDSGTGNIDYDRARELFLRVLRAQPSSETALFNLALTYEKLSLIEQAAETWRKFLGLKLKSEWRNEGLTRLGVMEKLSPGIAHEGFRVSPDQDLQNLYKNK